MVSCQHQFQGHMFSVISIIIGDLENFESRTGLLSTLKDYSSSSINLTFVESVPLLPF